MGKINWNRVLLGGLLAGLVLNIIDFVINSFVLLERWTAAMRALGKPGTMNASQGVAFILLDFLLGIFMLWLYAAKWHRES